MSKPVPTLSSSGWLTDVPSRADAIMAYYLTSDHSQSYLYAGLVTSLPYHVSQYGSSPDILESTVQSDVLALLNRYFDSAEVTVRTDIPNPTDPNRINLTLDAIIIDDSQRYSLGREIRIENRRVAKVIEVNNDG